ncbi:MAG TPA: hypothetical protein VES65_02190 [Solirubrobacteraceae bacterium]|nr:hypothetical protein [Solirubrobacteraceae bacterium]
MEIRSYRAVFDLERRIYRVDRLRLNPGGVPVRGVVYFLALLAAILLAGRAPLLRSVLGALPWYVLDVALPGASAALLTVIRIEGRPFHLAAQALARHRLGPPEWAGLHVCRSGSRGAPGTRWWPQEVLLLPDGSDGRMRRLRYTGPGAVLVTVAHARDGRASDGRGPLRGPAGRLAIGRAHVRLRESPRPSGRAGAAADGRGGGRDDGCGDGLDGGCDDGRGGAVIALAAKARLRVG